MDIATIGFEADTRGLEKANRALDETTRKSSAAERAASKWGAAAVVAGGQVKTAMVGAAASIGAVGPAMSAASSATAAFSSVLSGALLVAFGAVAAVIAVVVGSMGKFITASIEAEDIQAQLAAALHSTGGAAGQTAQMINKHAEALQALTTYEDDAIVSAQAMLLTFTKIQGDTFPKATTAILDMATAMRTDLKSATLQVGKALNDPVLGMTALSRSGIQFTESQKAMVKQLVETGDVAAAQAVILKELEIQFGGSAAAARDTLGGALKSLSITFGNLFELGGDQTNPLTSAINQLSEAVGDPAFKDFVNLVGVVLVQVLAFAANAAGRVAQGFNILVNMFKVAALIIETTLTDAVTAFASWFEEKFGVNLANVAKSTFNTIVGYSVAMYEEMKFNFSHLPDVIQSAAVSSINVVIAGFNAFIKFFSEKVDWLSNKANDISEKIGLGRPLGTIGQAGTIDPLANPAANRLTQGGGFFALSPLEEKQFNQRAAMAKDWFGALTSGAEKSKEKVNQVRKVVTDLGGDAVETGSKSEEAFKKIEEGAKQAADKLAVTEDQTKSMTGAMSFLKDIFSDLFSDLKDALISGKNLWKAFGDAALGVLSKVADKLLNMLLDGTMSAFFGGPNTGAKGSASSSSSGGLGDFLGLGGGLSDFLGTPITGPYAGMSPSSMRGVPVVGASSVSGTGITWGGALGAAGGLAGAGMNFAKGGTAGTIGGIASLIGAGVSLIPGIGQIAGPIISMLGGILPGLFGGSKPTITDREFGQLSFGSGGFSTSGGAWGPNARAENLQGPLGQIGQSMDAVFKAFGGIKDAGKVWGVALQSFSQKYGDDSTFSNQTSFVVDPSGNQRQFGMGSTEADIGLAAAGVEATIESVLGGAVGEITKNMRKVFEDMNAAGGATFETLATTVSEIMAFDEAIKSFGKTTTDAEAQIKAVDDSFAELYETAKKYSLAASEVAKIDAERARVRLKATEDFTFGISQGLLGFANPLQVQLNELEKQRQGDLANNEAYVRLVAGYADQAANIDRLYYLQRNELIEQANAEALASQQAVIDAQKSLLGSLGDYIKSLLPGGELAGEGMQDQLRGLQGAYSAARAQAFASPLDEKKVAAFMQAGAQLLEFEKSFFGGDTRFQDARMRALQDAKTVQDAVAAGLQRADKAAAAIPGGQKDPEVQALLASQADLNAQIAGLMGAVATLSAQLRRRSANG